MKMYDRMNKEDSTYRKVKYVRNSDGTLTPYISYYTNANMNNIYNDVDTESVVFEYEDNLIEEYTPGIDIPDYGDQSRENLPQIDFGKFFNDYGPEKFVRKRMKCTDLTPTQCEFNEGKVLNIMDSIMNDPLEKKPSPIVVSKDGKIVDGHHRWLAIHNLGMKDIEVYELDQSYGALMDSIRGKEYVKFASINESVIEESEFKGKKVNLNKPFRTPGEKKKFAVYTKNDKGNVVLVRFGDPKMSIKTSDPDRRKNFRARHNCSDPGPKWKARYWSCKAWSTGSVKSGLNESVSEIIEAVITPALVRRKEEILRTMKRDLSYYKKKYGKDYESVMHAVAMSVAKAHSMSEGESINVNFDNHTDFLNENFKP